jgi:hypothetical protein
MDKEALEGFIGVLDNWTAVFTLLVVIGVGGELVVHVWQSRANKKLIALQHTETLAQEAEIARLKNQSASFELAIATTKKEAGEANERGGRLEKEAAELTANNLRLEAAIAPRRLSERQQRGLATLTAFANRTVGIRSYANDTEGLVLATQIVDALTKSNIRVEDNRLTMQPAGSVSFGLSIDGPDKAVVQELRRIFSLDGDLTKGSSISSTSRGGFSAQVSFGTISNSIPPAATITVGVKPIK